MCHVHPQTKEDDGRMFAPIVLLTKRISARSLLRFVLPAPRLAKLALFTEVTTGLNKSWYRLRQRKTRSSDRV
jgi:hypothetical protein